MTSWKKIHNYAIECHKQAFDCEFKDVIIAFDYWRTSIDLWGQLFRDANFWEAIFNKGSLLQSSLFKNNSKFMEIKKEFPKFILEIHAEIICISLLDDIYRAKLHFSLINNSRLSASGTPEEDELIRRLSLQKIYSQFFDREVLKSKDLLKIAEATKLAKKIHQACPTSPSSEYYLSAILSLIGCIEQEINSKVHIYLNENYSDEEQIRENSEVAPDDVNEDKIELINGIKENDDIVELQNYQNENIPELINALEAALIFYRNELHIAKSLSNASSYIGRYYLENEDEKDFEEAYDYFEMASQFDPTNNYAKNILEYLEEYEITRS